MRKVANARERSGSNERVASELVCFFFSSYFSIIYERTHTHTHTNKQAWLACKEEHREHGMVSGFTSSQSSISSAQLLSIAFSLSCALNTAKRMRGTINNHVRIQLIQRYVLASRLRRRVHCFLITAVLLLVVDIGIGPGIDGERYKSRARRRFITRDREPSVRENSRQQQPIVRVLSECWANATIARYWGILLGDCDSELLRCSNAVQPWGKQSEYPKSRDDSEAMTLTQYCILIADCQLGKRMIQFPMNWLSV